MRPSSAKTYFHALLFCGISLLVTTIHAVEPIEFSSPEEEERYYALIEEIRCLVCQNQSLADSGAGLAQDLRDEVVRLMREGLTDSQIKTYLTDRYGDFVLYRPPLKPTTWILWFGPLVIVVIGLGGLVFVIRRRGVATVTPDPDQEELDRRLRDEE